MNTPRISASSYSNTAPLVWSFLYGADRSTVEVVLDTAPARSAELLAQDRVDAALVPVIAFQNIADVRLVPGICIGARERVRSVCLVTRGCELADVDSVALDVSSQTSAVLTRVLFGEFVGSSPQCMDAEPNIDRMLDAADCAMLIGDPALKLSYQPRGLRVFDLAELWHKYTGLGFIFAMWMTRRERVVLPLAEARDEGLAHIDTIAANYAGSVGLDQRELESYLTNNIVYTPDESMLRGMDLYFELAERHGLIGVRRKAEFV